MLNPSNLIVYLVALMFLIGMITFIAGVLVLTFRASSNDIRELSLQTSRLVQKGLAEEIAGLVGNATNLLEAMNQMVRNTRGIGIFLMLMGLTLMALAGWFGLKIYFGSLS